MNTNLNTEIISSLCFKHNVKTLYAFGSVLTDKFNEESDIDLLVEFSQLPLNEYADNYFDFKFSLQNILKRNIDLLEEKGLKNPYLKSSILQNSKLIYG